jgi:hypothetical protein
LELPHYWRALCWKNKHEPDRPSEQLEADLVALLSEKLRLAAEYSSGYGLDGTKSVGGSLAGILPGSVADNATEDTGGEQLDIQDSYESLNLPGLTGGESIDEEAGESKTVVPPPPHADDEDSLETPDMGRSSDHQNELTEQLQAVGDGEKLTGLNNDVLEDEEYGAEDWIAEDDEVAE